MKPRQASPEYPRVRLRPASEGEAPELTELVRRAKAHWGYPDEWLEAWRGELRVEPEYIRRHRVVVAETGERPVAFYGLELRPGAAWLEHLWVEPDFMGKGLGRRLFEHACRATAESGRETLELASDPNAESFYLHLGCVRIGRLHGQVLGTPRELPKLRFKLRA